MKKAKPPTNNNRAGTRRYSVRTTHAIQSKLQKPSPLLSSNLHFRSNQKSNIQHNHTNSSIRPYDKKRIASQSYKHQSPPSHGLFELRRLAPIFTSFHHFSTTATPHYHPKQVQDKDDNEDSGTNMHENDNEKAENESQMNPEELVAHLEGLKLSDAWSVIKDMTVEEAFRLLTLKIQKDDAQIFMGQEATEMQTMMADLKQRGRLQAVLDELKTQTSKQKMSPEASRLYELMEEAEKLTKKKPKVQLKREDTQSNNLNDLFGHDISPGMLKQMENLDKQMGSMFSSSPFNMDAFGDMFGQSPTAQPQQSSQPPQQSQQPPQQSPTAQPQQSSQQPAQQSQQPPQPTRSYSNAEIEAITRSAVEQALKQYAQHPTSASSTQSTAVQQSSTQPRSKRSTPTKLKAERTKGPNSKTNKSR